MFTNVKISLEKGGFDFLLVGLMLIVGCQKKNNLLSKVTKEFSNFLKFLLGENNALEVKRKYKKRMGKDFEAAVKDWKQWLEGIDKRSDIYGGWK